MIEGPLGRAGFSSVTGCPGRLPRPVSFQAAIRCRGTAGGKPAGRSLLAISLVHGTSITSSRRHESAASGQQGALSISDRLARGQPMTIMTGRATDWRASGACRDADPDLFFPISSVGRAIGQIAQAKAICACCPVRRQCLEFAKTNAPIQGIWGGTTPEERYPARRRDHGCNHLGCRNPLNFAAPDLHKFSMPLQNKLRHLCQILISHRFQSTSILVVACGWPLVACKARAFPGKESSHVLAACDALSAFMS